MLFTDICRSEQRIKRAGGRTAYSGIYVALGALELWCECLALEASGFGFKGFFGSEGLGLWGLGFGALGCSILGFSLGFRV